MPLFGAHLSIDPGRVRTRELELLKVLAKHVSEEEMEQRGIRKPARLRPRLPPGKGPERSPVAWWAGFVLSGDCRSR
jgi:hypothetical protein